MTFHNNKPNPNHHNYGRPANFNQRLSRRLNFINFATKGLVGNLSSAADELYQSIREPEFILLPEPEQLAIRGLINQIRNLQSITSDLGQDAAEINRDKTCLSLGQKKPVKQKA